MKPNQPFLIAYPSVPSFGFDKLFNEVSGQTVADDAPMGPYEIPAADGSDSLMITVYSDGDFNTVLPADLGVDGEDPSFAVSGEVNTNVGGLGQVFAVYAALKALSGDDLAQALAGQYAEAQSIQTPALPSNYMFQAQFVPAQAGSGQ